MIKKRSQMEKNKIKKKIGKHSAERRILGGRGILQSYQLSPSSVVPRC